MSSPLHTLEVLPKAKVNHVFALVYICSLLALFYYHCITLLRTTTFASLLLHFSLVVSDAILAFMWTTTQAFRIRPVKRKAYPENLPSVVEFQDYPALDVFICTADPHKEPPINVVNTALSVMAYDYPADKISVYVSDDGGSVLTLFAFLEAAKFATHWLPFCREKDILERCPEAYFRTHHAHTWCSETEKIKTMYEVMKQKVESVVERGKVGEAQVTGERDSKAFNKFAKGFTRQEHPAVVQVLLESGVDRDITGHNLPNLIYVSREKSRTTLHHFKAGALNALLRVSATMTNAPLILTQDCDMYSNDPKTPLNALCYLMDPTEEMANLAYVQFPQRFHGVHKHDIYASEIRRLFQINAEGMDGFSGPNYLGTGCFFHRRAFFGGPSSQLSAEIPELNPDHLVENSIQSERVLGLAHNVASCKYDNKTNWGSKIGFIYGSLSEDLNTSFRLLCDGWKSVLCDPDRPAFLGDIPITLNDALSQTRRWAIGQLEVGFSRYSPVTFGAKSMGLPMGWCFAHYSFWAFWSIPLTLYALLPPLALLRGVSMFPRVSSPWFFVYLFLFLASYGQDCLDFIAGGGTLRKWYNDQRMWMIRGVSSKAFGLVDYVCKLSGLSAFGFSVTSKVVDDEENKRYEQGLFEFGVASPLFVPPTTFAIINFIAFVVGLTRTLVHGNLDELFIQLSISGFVVVNSWPIYEAIVMRVDNGKMPSMTTIVSLFLAWALYSATFLTLRS